MELHLFRIFAIMQEDKKYHFYNNFVVFWKTDRDRRRTVSETRSRKNLVCIISGLSISEGLHAVGAVSPYAIIRINLAGNNPHV